MNIGRIYPKRVGPTPVATGVSTVVFTADQRYGVERFIFTNVAGVDATVTVNILRSSASSDTTNRFLSDISVPANDTYIANIPVILDKEDRIYALASNAMNLMFHVSTVEIENP